MNVKRYYVPRSVVFITQFVYYRYSMLCTPAVVNLLRSTLREVQALHPFKMIGYVFLPEHLHLLIRPTDTGNFSQIMHSFKPNFTKKYENLQHVDGRLQFWQKGFRDHIIRDQDDLICHLDYIHYNPVRHRLVIRPEDWDHSSHRYWHQRGAYPERWSWTLPDSIADFNRAQSRNRNGTG